MKTVQDMWQHRLDALHDVQPTLAEALADRGLPEMAVLVRAEAGDSDATAEGERGHGRKKHGVRVLLKTMGARSCYGASSFQYLYNGVFLAAGRNLLIIQHVFRTWDSNCVRRHTGDRIRGRSMQE